ncbi:MAG: FliM/FliN family flagellar motor switch protein [bacterium]|jgi:flagellar motor switch protein FliM
MDQKEAQAADQPKQESPANGLKSYDFRNPSRLSREHIRKIEYLHSSIAKRLAVSLAGLIRDSVNVEVVEVKEISYDELVKMIPVPGAAFSFAVEPLGGLGIMDIDMLLAFSLVDRLFGGKGEPLSEPRELTTIEQGVVKKVVSKVLAEVKFAWSALGEIDLGAPKYVPSLEFLSSPSFNESMVCVRLEIEKGELNASISVIYPYMMLEPIIKMSRRSENKADRGAPNAESEERIKRVVPLELTATLPVSMIRFGELMNLDRGDVLILDTRVSDEIYMRVGDRRLLAGRPGKSRGNLAVKVTSVIDKGGS